MIYWWYLLYYDVVQNNYSFSEFHFTNKKNIFVSGIKHYYIFSFETLMESIDCIKLSFFVSNCYKPIYNKYNKYITEYNSRFFIVSSSVCAYQTVFPTFWDSLCEACSADHCLPGSLNMG